MRIINDDDQEVDVSVYCKRCGAEKNELNEALRHIMLNHMAQYAAWIRPRGNPKRLTKELANDMMMEFFTE